MFLIIHNPLSSNKKSKRKTKKVVKYFQKKGIEFILRSTLKITNLKSYLNKRKNITDILFLGGDGSINYLINNVNLDEIEQNIYLGKSGSGNDFFKSLKPLKSANVTIGEANLDNKAKVKFINGCGLGFDGLVSHYVNNDSKKGRFSYFINVFRAILKYKSQTIKVIIDDKAYSFNKAFIASIQNGRYFGGGMKAAPKANIESDSYYVIVAHDLNKFLLQLLLLTIYPGWHRFIKSKITILKGKNIEITLEHPAYFQADGEVKGDIKYISVKAKQKKILHAFSKNII
ncbi:MAG: diacylglycerol/lipid kinase family protein [Bacillota bacterium]